MKKGVLASDDMLGCEDAHRLAGLKYPRDFLHLSNDSRMLLESGHTDTNWQQMERFRAEKEKHGAHGPYGRFIECLEVRQSCRQQPKVVFSYDKPVESKDVTDFVRYYNARYRQTEQILRNRPELLGLSSIARVNQKRDREAVSVIGMVMEKGTTPSGHIMLDVEDTTGAARVLVSNSKPEAFDAARNLVHDEVVGIHGTCGDRIIFCDRLVYPDIPTGKELKRAPSESYAAFLSDLHVGSFHFLRKEFEKFLGFLNGEVGNAEHREIVEKLKYIFIVGDLVAGVGVYPGQENELDIKDIYRQHEECAELLGRIPKNMHIILCPGNHDSTRLSEPQQAFAREFAGPLYSLPNATIVSNPSVINIAAEGTFAGFDVLMYHGYSFDYYISNVDEIRNKGGYDKPELVMRFLLQRRHLAPSHGSTLYIPDGQEDPLFISRVPDFFVSGHIHKSCVSSYRNVSLICGSCWESTTPFQQKVGHRPEPALVPIVNLKTRKTRLMRF